MILQSKTIEDGHVPELMFSLFLPNHIFSSICECF